MNMGGKCGKCGKVMRIIRTDNIPFCAECEKKITAEVSKITGAKKPLKMRSLYVAEES